MIFPLLHYVGLAVAQHGLRALSGVVPMGSVLFDVAKEALVDWRRNKREKECLEEIEAVAQAEMQKIREEVKEVTSQVASKMDSQQEAQALSIYLSQIPASIRQSLRRPADPKGTTVPRGMSMKTPEDLLSVLPSALPRFKPGDRPLDNVDWELVELLGVGGFGEVWKAKHPDFDGVPPVALKFCIDEEAKDRLLRHEASILNQVMKQGEHPGIVTLRHTYLRANPPCLEYEYIEGGNLSALIHQSQRNGGLNPQQAGWILLQLAETIYHAHKQQPPIVHRDLKPANILIQLDDQKQLNLKVADFGIGGIAAKQALDEATRAATTRSTFMTNVVRGAYTPLYSSPQQQGGEPPDPRDDVYSLGVIWFQLLTGDMRRGAPSGLQWANALQEQGVPEKHVHLMASCFEADPQHRPTDAGVLVQEIQSMTKKKKSQPPILAVSESEIITPETKQPRKTRSSTSSSPSVPEAELAPPALKPILISSEEIPEAIPLGNPPSATALPPQTVKDKPDTRTLQRALRWLEISYGLLILCWIYSTFCLFEKERLYSRASRYSDFRRDGGYREKSKSESSSRSLYYQYRGEARDYGERVAVMLIIGAGLQILTVVFFLRLLALLWRVIPASLAPTTRGIVLKLLIPLFNFYWLFIAFRGLAVRLNAVAQKRGVTIRVSVFIATLTCILSCLIVIPIFAAALADLEALFEDLVFPAVWLAVTLLTILLSFLTFKKMVKVAAEVG